MPPEDARLASGSTPFPCPNGILQCDARRTALMPHSGKGALLRNRSLVPSPSANLVGESCGTSGDSRLGALWNLSCRLTRADLLDHRLTQENIRRGSGQTGRSLAIGKQSSITSSAGTPRGRLQPGEQTSNRHSPPLPSFYPIFMVWAPRFSRLPFLDCRKYPKPLARDPADTHNALPIYIRRLRETLSARDRFAGHRNTAADSDQARYCGLILGGYFRGSFACQ